MDLLLNSHIKYIYNYIYIYIFVNQLSVFIEGDKVTKILHYQPKDDI